MKMAPQGGKGFVLFVTLRGTTRANAAMAHVEGIAFCNNRDKHPEVKAEIQDLQKVLKELEK